jgi:hypothetical protein
MDAGPVVTGRLVVRRGERVEGVRSMQAQTCSEAAEALALMVALAFDPSLLLDVAASVEPSPSAPAPVASAPSPPLEATVEPAVTEAPPPPPAAVRSRASPSAARDAATPSAASAPVAPQTFYLGTDVAVASNVSPDLLVGLSPYVGWHSGQRGWFQPGARLAFLRGSSGSIAAAGGTATLVWNVGRADACLLSWPGLPVHVVACARIEAGTLEGDATRITAAQSSTRAWLATGPLVRVEWSAIGSLFLDAEAAAMFHVTDDRFYFAPDATIDAVPVWGPEVGGGVGVHFL